MKKTMAVLILAAFFVIPIVVLADEENEIEAGLLPDNPFYFLDKWGEWVELNIFTWNKEAKMKLMMQYLEEKQKEVEKMTEKGKKLEKTAKAVREHARYMERILERAEEMKKTGQDIQEIISKLQNNLNRQQENLERVYEKVPEEAKEAILRAMENSRRGLERAMEEIQKEKKKPDATILVPGQVGEKMRNNLQGIEEQFQNTNKEAEELTGENEGIEVGGGEDEDVEEIEEGEEDL